MIARRFTLICFATAIVGTVLAGFAADSVKTQRPWPHPPCDLLGADACRPGH